MENFVNSYVLAGINTPHTITSDEVFSVVDKTIGEDDNISIRLSSPAVIEHSIVGGVKERARDAFHGPIKLEAGEYSFVTLKEYNPSSESMNRVYD